MDSSICLTLLSICLFLQTSAILANKLKTMEANGVVPDVIDVAPAATIKVYYTHVTFFSLYSVLLL